MDNETVSNNESNENTKSRKCKVIDISNNENPKSGNPKINKFPNCSWKTISYLPVSPFEVEVELPKSKQLPLKLKLNIEFQLLR
ncbi:unnamed protein product [Rhizophagus irregularis]|nr:unnamed protein product [Rhizophagus irregularis]CAB5367620.1 unnamed protein product [Rhizophagus irregularis]